MHGHIRQAPALCCDPTNTACIPDIRPVPEASPINPSIQAFIQYSLSLTCFHTDILHPTCNAFTHRHFASHLHCSHTQTFLHPNFTHRHPNFTHRHYASHLHCFHTQTFCIPIPHTDILHPTCIAAAPLARTPAIGPAPEAAATLLLPVPPAD